MGAVLVESQEVGVDVITQLKEKTEGRATFIPINRFVGGRGAGVRAGRGRARALLDLVKFGEDYRAWPRRCSATCCVVEDLLTALDRWRAGDQRTYVTLDGEVVDATASSPAARAKRPAAGILAQKREIRELDGIITELESQHNDAQFRHAAAARTSCRRCRRRSRRCARKRTRARCRS